MLFGCTAFAPTTTQLKEGRAAPQVLVANWERGHNLPQAILFFFPRRQLPPLICHSTSSPKIKSRAIITSRTGGRRQGDHLDEKHFSQVCMYIHLCLHRCIFACMCMSGLYMDTYKRTGFVWVNSPGAATNMCKHCVRGRAGVGGRGSGCISWHRCQEDYHQTVHRPCNTAVERGVVTQPGPFLHRSVLMAGE